MTALEGRVRATTVVAVIRDGEVAMASDGQVTVGEAVMKQGAAKVRRSISMQALFSIVLGSRKPSAQLARKNPDVRRALKLHLESVRSFPENPQSLDWAMLRVTHPEEAARVGEAVRKSDLRKIMAEMGVVLNPMSGDVALEADVADVQGERGARGTDTGGGRRGPRRRRELEPPWLKERRGPG